MYKSICTNKEDDKRNFLVKKLSLQSIYKSLPKKCLYLFFKRLTDIVLSLAALITLSPLFLIITIAIKCVSKGSIFFKSYRIGLHGKPICCLKFRTMHSNAQTMLENLLQKDSALKQEWKQYQKLKNDPRIHKFGNFLRKTSLDELPQLLNILQGTLTLVGPRPYNTHQKNEYLKESAPYYLSVKPGLTGLWQISGRNLLTMQQRLILEDTYIRKSSYLYDWKLILKTVPALIFSKGAY